MATRNLLEFVKLWIQDLRTVKAAKKCVTRYFCNEDQELQNYIRLYTWSQKVQTSWQRKDCIFVSFINDLCQCVDGNISYRTFRQNCPMEFSL